MPEICLQLTWADLAFFGFLSMLADKFSFKLKDATHLNQLVVRVGEIPNIKKWVEERPKTIF